MDRRVSNRSIGSTLLVKDLEFERAVVVGTPDMSKKDWYVVLTRSGTYFLAIEFDLMNSDV